jgi:DNA-binding transcriptional LysR family regulator
MTQSQAEPVRLARADAQVPQALELRHLRYLVAVAEAGTFTRAAEQVFIAQPTLSQQIGRLEQLIGTPLLVRGRDGVWLTTAGAVLLDVSRDVLSLVDHGVSRTRQAAGLGRQRLRVVMPGNLPEALTVKTATLLRSATTAADVDLVWMETPLDAEFSPIRQHQADAGLGWLTGGLDELPAPLDAMTLGEFEPDLWIPASHPAASRGTISLAEMASLHVIHGPRRASPGTYDQWLDVLRTVDPHFAFTDPPFRHSLPVTLAFAATADPPAAVLTGRTAFTITIAIAGASPGVIRRLLPADTGDMVLVSIADRPLTATAALVWNGDLPRPLQQILFDTADGAAPPAPASLSRAG